VHSATDPDELLDHLETHPPVHTDKWIEGIEET
jgi:hypothetical protein